MSDAALLKRLRRQVADREAIDWSAVESRSWSAEDLGELAMIQLLDRVGQAHETFQSEDEHPDPVTRAPALAEGTLTSWGRYRVDEPLGRGGFGTVYRGWDPKLQMPVAIKILHPRVEPARIAARLLTEGQAVAQVTHPNVVRVLNVEENDGRLGLVMEFLRGETLDAMIARGTMNEREATVVGEDVCRALAAVHGTGVLHRDVKARNIMRDSTGRIVLMDFGAGLAVDREPQAGAVGTPLYMAPELLTGGPSSVASDVYAVGVLLFFLVTRRFPVEGTRVEEIRAAHATGRRSLLELRPDLPLPFVQVVDRALAADPRSRYPSATALLQGLIRARDAAPRWRTWVVRGILGVVVLATVMTLAGMLSSAAFNLSLGRSAYATESFADWFTFGRKSLLMPLVLALLAVGAVGLAAVIRNLLVTVSTRARRVDRAVTARYHTLARRLSLHDTTVCSCWLILLTALGAIAVGVYWAPLLTAMTSYVTQAPAETLAILAPASEVYQVNYRMALTLLAAANLAGWYGLVRVSRGHGRTLPRWLLGTEIAMLVLLYGSMQVPYRLIHDSDAFAVVRWRDERCYVLGARAEDRLLFCPKLSPRLQRVPASGEPLLPLNVTENLFETFAPRVP